MVRRSAHRGPRLGTAHRRNAAPGSVAGRPTVRDAILAAIRVAFPDGIVELRYQLDESPALAKISGIRRRLARMSGAVLLLDRPADVEPLGEPCDEDGADEPVDREPTRSYDLFFVAPTGPRIEFDAVDQVPGDDGVPVDVPGTGTWGCAVGISHIAPFALVAFDALERFENGQIYAPDVRQRWHHPRGRPIEWDKAARATLGDKAFDRLARLRHRIRRTIERQGIVVLDEAEANERVCGLRAAEDVLLGKRRTVADLLFFETW